MLSPVRCALASSVFRCSLVMCVLVLISIASFAQDVEEGVMIEPPPQAARGGDDERLGWWRDARFGMFIHWGLYAIPAGEWKGTTNHAEWIRTTAQIPLETYDKFVDRFNPVEFDAEEWVRLAKEAGMKYIVITTKHHDGFALFDSAHSEFDVMATPFARDIMAELAEACRRHGLRIGWYHSIMDWHHPDYLPRRGWETDRPTANADYDAYVDYLHKQVTELLTNYGDIGVMWYDGEWESTWTHEHGVELYNLTRRLQPDIIVNNRVDKGREGMAGLTREGEFKGDFGTPEQEIPATGLPGIDWETCMTMNDHWGYNKHDENWKSVQNLIHKLCDIASKGGNFLLNVGPKADGTFPQASIDRLRAIGQWMEVNSESIYGTEASPFGAFAWGRCTYKPDATGSTLYFHVFEWPSGDVLRVDGLDARVTSAMMLEGRETLSIDQSGPTILIHLPEQAPDPIASVVKITVEGRPAIYREPGITAPSDVFVNALPVTIDAGHDDVVVRYTTDGTAPRLASPRYDGPITITGETTVRARSFKDDKPVSGVGERTFRVVEPHAAVDVSGASPGVRVMTYEGDFRSLADLVGVDAAHTGVRPTIALGDDEAGEYIAHRFVGFIRVERDALYRFALTSDDGSRLLIQDEVVVDNDGLHVAERREGAIALEAGWHPIVVEWFNRTGDVALSLSYAPLGGSFVPVTASMLSHAGEK